MFRDGFNNSMISASNIINFLNPSAPKGIIKSASQWVENVQNNKLQFRHPQPQAAQKDVFPEEDTINKPTHEYISTAHDEFDSIKWTKSSPAKLFYLQKCRILGREGAIISPDNKLFCEFTQPPRDQWLTHSCFKRRRIPPIKQLKGWYATITYPESQFFFHWMIESLPRMALLEEYISILDGIFVPNNLSKFHLESLHALGIGADKLICLDVDSHFQPQHLFVPKTFAMYNPQRWVHHWFKNTYLKVDIGDLNLEKYSKRIYVSRNDAPARRVSNEAELVNILKKYNFEILRLSELSFLEQARIFNNASIVVAPHGAGLSNIVFCQPKTKIIEIFPKRWMAPCFFALANAVGGEYKHIVADELSPSTDGNPQYDNIHVPISDFEKTLIEILI